MTADWTLVTCRCLGCWKDNTIKISVMDQWTEDFLYKGRNKLHNSVL